MEVLTESLRDQQIAMDRIKYFLGGCIANCIFINESEKKAIEKFTAAGIKVCPLPEDPYDQIISLLLILKLNAITEGRLCVTDITLFSDLSDGVMFDYAHEEALANPFDKNGWWNDSSTSTSNKINKKEKVVKITKNSDWFAQELAWSDTKCNPEKIIFTTEK